MNKRITYIYIIIAFSILSCNNVNHPGKNEFPIEVHLQSDTIKIDEIIELQGIYKLKDYIVLKDGSLNADDFFYVYSLKDFSFLYSFARRGNGPEEFLMPSCIKNSSNNNFEFRDHAVDILYSYEITDSIPKILKSTKLQTEDSRYCWEINRLDSELYLLKRNDSKWSRRELWDLENYKLVDSLSNSFDLANKLGEKYFTDYDDFWISSSCNKFVCAYFFIDRLDIGEVNSNKLKLTSFIGSEKSPDFYLFNEKSKNKRFEYNMDNNIVFYESVIGTSTYIYALYSGLPWGDVEKEHSKVIEQYDWNGIPIKKLVLNTSLSEFVIDEGSNTLYGINPTESDECIFLYYLN